MHYISTETEKAKTINVGWAFLRIWMSFGVVLVHYWYQQGPICKGLWIFHKTDMLAVPVFMLLTFVLNEKTITSGTTGNVIHRFYRLVLPYIAWAIIYWGIYSLCEISIGGELVNGLHDLKWQLLLGSADNLNPPMWYQWDLIVLTAFFCVLCRGAKHRNNIVIHALFWISLCLQYANINGKLFQSYCHEIMYPLGRICEMIPYACVGIIISRLEWLDRLKNNAPKVIIICSVTCLFLIYFEVFTTPNGYAYQGLSKLVLAICLVVVFYLLPFGNLPKKVQKGILFISKYSMGIYCCHFLIGRLLNTYLYPMLGWRINTFKECLLIYAISLLCSCLIANLPYKRCRDLVV